MRRGMGGETGAAGRVSYADVLRGARRAQERSNMAQPALADQLARSCAGSPGLAWEAEASDSEFDGPQLSDYEFAVHHQVRLWEKQNRLVTRGEVYGILDRVRGGLLRVLAKVFPSNVSAMFSRAVLQTLKVLEDAAFYSTSLDSIEDFVRRQAHDRPELAASIERRGFLLEHSAPLDLKERDTIAAAYSRSTKITALLEGAGLGLGGAACVALDVPSLILLALRLLVQLSYVYGFDPSIPEEKTRLLGLLHLSSHAEQAPYAYEDISSSLLQYTERLEDSWLIVDVKHPTGSQTIGDESGTDGSDNSDKVEYDAAVAAALLSGEIECLPLQAGDTLIRSMIEDSTEIVKSDGDSDDASSSNSSSSTPLSEHNSIVSDLEHASAEVMAEMATSAWHEAAARVAHGVGQRLAHMKLAQMVPVMGALVGAGVNYVFIRRVMTNARMALRRRYLLERHGVDHSFGADE